MRIPRLWLTTKETVQALGKEEQAVRRLIRLNQFPFKWERVGNSYMVSVRSLGIDPAELSLETREAQLQDQSFATTA
ncbi:MAG TPA: hypothetical protein VKE91_05185 [Blastocatellia bacterium]|nr:hypothetical protein [Blastocatellia bacterium]